MDTSLYALPVDPEQPPKPAMIDNHLDIGSLPRGTTRLLVELVGDGLSMGLRVPCLVARGNRPGGVFGLTAGLHGNELNGIPVIHEVFNRLDPDELRGTVVGVICANVPGLHMQQREFNDGTDLNRIMPGNERGGAAQVYSARLLDRIIRHFNFLIDLHTASFGRVNSLYVRADMKNTVTASMAYRQVPQIIVHNEAADGTLRGAAMDLGIPAITLEIGDPQQWQERYTTSAVAGIWRVMSNRGFVDRRPEEGIDIPMPVICRSSKWMYTDRGGLLEVFPGVAEFVKEGDLVGRVRTAFGDTIREYKAPRDGIVVGRSVNPVGQTGARILHLGVPAPAEEQFLAATQCAVPWAK